MKRVTLTILIFMAATACTRLGITSREWYDGPPHLKGMTEKGIDAALITIRETNPEFKFDHGRWSVRIRDRQPDGNIRGVNFIYDRAGNRNRAYWYQGTSEIIVISDIKFEELVHELIHLILDKNGYSIGPNVRHEHPAFQRY